MGSPPDWLLLASPVVALFASVLSASIAYATVRSSNRNQAEQRQLQRNLQQVDLEEKKQADLRTQRREAYRTMGRLGTTVDPSKPYELADLAEAHFDVEMMSDSAEVQEAAANLYRAAFDARKEARRAWKSRVRPAHKDPDVELAVRRAHEMKGRFMDAARKELGLPPRPMQRQYPLEIRQVMMPPVAQDGSRFPWWRRVFGV